MAFALRPWMPRLASFPAALSVIVFAGSARAEPQEANKVRLEYVREPGAEECAGEKVLRHIIRDRTKHDPFSPTAKASLRVVVVRVGQVFQASYELRDDEEKLLLARQLPKHKECAVALQAAAFSVGVFMPSLLTAPVASAPAPAPAPPPPSPSPPPLPSPRSSPPPRPSLPSPGVAFVDGRLQPRPVLHTIATARALVPEESDGIDCRT
jgi:hypothetical protein